MMRFPVDEDLLPLLQGLSREGTFGIRPAAPAGAAGACVPLTGDSPRPLANTASHAVLNRCQIFSRFVAGNGPTSFQRWRRRFTSVHRFVDVAAVILRSCSACSHRSTFFCRLLSRACS